MFSSILSLLSQVRQLLPPIQRQGRRETASHPDERPGNVPTLRRLSAPGKSRIRLLSCSRHPEREAPWGESGNPEPGRVGGRHPLRDICIQEDQLVKQQSHFSLGCCRQLPNNDLPKKKKLNFCCGDFPARRTQRL